MWRIGAGAMMSEPSSLFDDGGGVKDATSVQRRPKLHCLPAEQLIKVVVVGRLTTSCISPRHGPYFPAR